MTTTTTRTEPIVDQPSDNFEQFLDEFDDELEKMGGFVTFESFHPLQLTAIFNYISNNYVQVVYPNGRPPVDLSDVCPEYYQAILETSRLLEAEREALIKDGEAVRIAAGLDDPSFLVHLEGGEKIDAAAEE